ncbi:MAG: hypothetical protein P1V36_07355 [Planctomycetota bacterium]|nr:hypothetical protein [Planctomycetota bacterium]
MTMLRTAAALALLVGILTLTVACCGFDPCEPVADPCSCTNPCEPNPCEPCDPCAAAPAAAAGAGPSASCGGAGKSCG